MICSGCGNCECECKLIGHVWGSDISVSEEDKLELFSPSSCPEDCIEEIVRDESAGEDWVGKELEIFTYLWGERSLFLYCDSRS